MRNIRPDRVEPPSIIVINRFGFVARCYGAKLAVLGFQDRPNVIGVQTILRGIGAKAAFGHPNGALGAHPQVARAVFAECRYAPVSGQPISGREFLETLPPVENPVYCQPAMGSNPKRALRGFKQRFNRLARQFPTRDTSVFQRPPGQAAGRRNPAKSPPRSCPKPPLVVLQQSGDYRLRPAALCVLASSVGKAAVEAAHRAGPQSSTAVNQQRIHDSVFPVLARHSDVDETELPIAGCPIEVVQAALGADPDSAGWVRGEREDNSTFGIARTIDFEPRFGGCGMKAS